MAWKTMDTAPKDGTHVLLFIKWIGHPVVGHFDTHNNWWTASVDHLTVEDSGWYSGGIGYIMDDFSQDDVLHWMELPADPT